LKSNANDEYKNKINSLLNSEVKNDDKETNTWAQVVCTKRIHSTEKTTAKLKTTPLTKSKTTENKKSVKNLKKSENKKSVKNIKKSKLRAPENDQSVTRKEKNGPNGPTFEILSTSNQKTDSKESKNKNNKSHDNTWNVVHHKNNKNKKQKMEKSSEKTFSKKEMSVKKINQSLMSIEGESKQNNKNETNSIRIGLTKDCATIDIDTIHLDLPLVIQPTMAVFDEGSNTNLTDQTLDGPTKTIRGTVNGWNNKNISSTFIVGDLGKMSNVISIPNGKNIIVPAHARKIYKNTIMLWLYVEQYEIHICLLCPMDKSPATVIAVNSENTNNVSRWTIEGLKLLGIHGIKKMERTFKIEGSSFSKQFKKNSSSNMNEINVTNMKDRYTTCTSQLLKVVMGGIGETSIRNMISNKTIGGLDDVVIVPPSSDYSNAKSKFTHERKLPKRLRIRTEEPFKPGECLIMDYIFFHSQVTGGMKTNIIARGGYKGGILVVDQKSGRPWFRLLKTQKIKPFKLGLRKLLKQIKSDIDEAPYAVKTTTIKLDQNKTQMSNEVQLLIQEEFGIDHCKYGRLDSNDLGKLNRVSGILHSTAHYYLVWGSMELEWIGHAYQHAVLLFYFRPMTHRLNKNGLHPRGRGFSPHTQWTGILLLSHIFQFLYLYLLWDIHPWLHALVRQILF